MMRNLLVTLIQVAQIFQEIILRLLLKLISVAELDEEPQNKKFGISSQYLQIKYCHRQRGY